MKMTSILLGTAAFVASAGIAVAGPSTVGHNSKGHHGFKGVDRQLSVLYDQHGTDSGIGIVSQNFESTFAAYDAAAADDFSVAGGGKASEVDANGVYFNGYGPASSEDVTFYKNKKGKPGKVVKASLGVAGTDDGFGSFTIPVTKTKLKAGKTYWVSVVANCSFTGGCGEWGWENQTTIVGTAAQWQNPGGGFGVCPTWDDENVCIPDGQGDHMFTIRGK